LTELSKKKICQKNQIKKYPKMPEPREIPASFLNLPTKLDSWRWDGCSGIPISFKHHFLALYCWHRHPVRKSKKNAQIFNNYCLKYNIKVSTVAQWVGRFKGGAPLNHTSGPVSMINSSELHRLVERTADDHRAHNKPLAVSEMVEMVQQKSSKIKIKRNYRAIKPVSVPTAKKIIAASDVQFADGMPRTDARFCPGVLRPS
jgi:transposase